MKKRFLILAVCVVFIVACAPTQKIVQDAIEKTQVSEVDVEATIQAGIEQTLAAAPTATDLPPTPTEKATLESPTNTPEPTLAPPTKVPATVVPATRIPPTPTEGKKLPLDITIKVKNQCSVQKTVIFEGPMRLKYVVDPGEIEELQAARGLYTWYIDGVLDDSMELTVAVWTLTLCY